MAASCEQHLQSPLNAISELAKGSVISPGFGIRGNPGVTVATGVTGSAVDPTGASTKTGASATAASGSSKSTSDPRAGGGNMNSLQDPPPPPLAANVALSSLQCQLAVENLCVAASQLLSLIRTLRLSLLLMDEATIVAEEEWQVEQVRAITEKAMQEADVLEQKWMEYRNQETN